MSFEEMWASLAPIGRTPSTGIGSSMHLVRNATGISHAPGESATTEDCLARVEALTRALEDVLR